MSFWKSLFAVLITWSVCRIFLTWHSIPYHNIYYFSLFESSPRYQNSKEYEISLTDSTTVIPEFNKLVIHVCIISVNRKHGVFIILFPDKTSSLLGNPRHPSAPKRSCPGSIASTFPRTFLCYWHNKQIILSQSHYLYQCN